MDKLRRAMRMSVKQVIINGCPLNPLPMHDGHNVSTFHRVTCLLGPVQYRRDVDMMRYAVHRCSGNTETSEHLPFPRVPRCKLWSETLSHADTLKRAVHRYMVKQAHTVDDVSCLNMPCPPSHVHISPLHVPGASRARATVKGAYCGDGLGIR